VDDVSISVRSDRHYAGTVTYVTFMTCTTLKSVRSKKCERTATECDLNVCYYFILYQPFICLCVCALCVSSTFKQ